MATSKVLAAALRQLNADLVICGAESTDGRVQVMPHMLAERLGVAALTGARKLTVDGSTLTVERQTEEGYEVVTASTPAVVSRLGHHQRAALPVVQGHHGRQEEAGRRRSRWPTWASPRTRSASTVPPAPSSSTASARRAPAATKITDEGEGGVKLVEFLASEKFV